MSLTNAGANLVLAWLLTTGTAARPTAWEVALHTGDPGVDAAANEVTTGEDADYVRKSISFDAPASEQDTSAGAVTWTVATGSSGYTVTHLSLWDSANAVALAYTELSAIRALVADQVLTFNAGDILAAAS